MDTELGFYVRHERMRQGLTLQALARKVGYRNLDKGARRLERLERTGREEKDLVDRAIVALGLDAARAAELAARDDAARKVAFEKWAKVPQPMMLFQMTIGITVEHALPENATEQQAIDFALDMAKTGVRMCLVLDRRRSMWISPGGKTTTLTLTTPDSPNLPYTTLG
jgi:hypothetical protein